MKISLKQQASASRYCLIFTLVELLVVISVISILLTILLPALKNAQGKAKEVGCKNNMKQLGLGFGVYVNDYNGWLPQKPVDKTVTKCWDYQLADYVNYKAVGSAKNWGPPLFHCLAGKIHPAEYPGSSHGYAMNNYVGENLYQNGKITGVGKSNQMLVIEY